MSQKPSAKVAITLYKREYVVNCDPGQEERLARVVELVQKEMEAVAGNVGNSTEPRHLMLTCLSLADKLLEARNQASQAQAEQEDLFVAAVNHLKGRVESLASQIGRA